MSRDVDDVREVLAKYVRATDSRDGAAMAKLFAPSGRVEIYVARGESAGLLGELVGPEAIGHAVGALMEPHPPGGSSHHTTQDPIVTIDGDKATIDAQYIVYSVRQKTRPASGWPAGARGAQGTVTPIESGYYRSTLARAEGRWLFVYHRIDQDLPMVFPSQST
jgi:hypothetical protein